MQTDIEINHCTVMDILGRPICEDSRADPRILKALQDIGKLDTKPDPEGWGESFQGVKVRLAADRPEWKQGDEPSFRIEVLNAGDRELQIPIGPNACLLHVDDTWFKSAADKRRGPLAVGGRHESTVILQSEIWQPHGELLNLKPSKHEVQVVYDLIGSPYMDLRLLSNTVEVEILPADTKK